MRSTGRRTVELPAELPAERLPPVLRRATPGLWFVETLDRELVNRDGVDPVDRESVREAPEFAGALVREGAVDRAGAE